VFQDKLATDIAIILLRRDLQTTNIAAAKIHSATIEDLSQLLYTLHLLKVYPTEEQKTKQVAPL
jgi:hypothetical protein